MTALAKALAGVRLPPLPRFCRRLSSAVIDKPAASQDDPAAWLPNGATAYKMGQYFSAFGHWKRASDSGDPRAQYLIGRLYARGEGVVRNLPDAVAWYRRAAEAGHIAAQFRLGTIYLNGGASGANAVDRW